MSSLTWCQNMPWLSFAWLSMHRLKPCSFSQKVVDNLQFCVVIASIPLVFSHNLLSLVKFRWIVKPRVNIVNYLQQRNYFKTYDCIHRFKQIVKFVINWKNFFWFRKILIHNLLYENPWIHVEFICLSSRRITHLYSKKFLFFSPNKGMFWSCNPMSQPNYLF